MYTFKRGLRPLALPVLLAFLLAASFTATASATTVNLRIESPATTVFNGQVNSGPRNVTTLAGNCDGASSSVAIANPTTVTAVADAIDTLGPGAPAFASGYNGTYICTVGSFVEAYPNGSWFLKINNQDSPQPVGYVTAGDTLHEGDNVLVYYSAGNPTESLDIKLPASTPPGVAVGGLVNAYANQNNDTKSPGAGATISGGGATTTAATDGSFSLTFPTSGRYLITASKNGAVRGSSWITVDPAAPAPPAIVIHANRFVKCNKTYKQSSKMHKRCVRIVRAKQAAAKKQAAVKK